MSQRKKSRIELLNLKKQGLLVAQGIKILSSKRDALMREFRGLVRAALEVRKKLTEKMGRGGTTLMLANAAEPYRGLVTAGLAAQRDIKLKTSIKTVWGVKIPSIETPPLRRGPFERGSSPGYRSPAVDETAGQFEEIIGVLVESAVAESRLSGVGGAVKKTNRRLNALEMRVAPEIKRETAVIRLHLDELAREETFRLKRFKTLRERKFGAAG